MMMLHQRFLHTAFCLITRSILFSNRKETMILVRAASSNVYSMPRLSKCISSCCFSVSGGGRFNHPFPTSTQPITFHFATPTRKRFTTSSTRTYTLLYSQSSTTKHGGAVIHRSQSPTHLDHVEDAVNSSLVYYQEKEEQHQQTSSESSNEATSQQQNAMPPSPHIPQNNILNYAPQDRETIGIATHLKKRLQGLANSGDCRRCWLQKRHCVCDYCVPLEEEGIHDEEVEDDIANYRSKGRGIPNVNRLFLLTHHKEICLTVDTAKLILAAFPTTTRLVVSGIGSEFQPSLAEMLEAVSNAALNKNINNNNNGKCLILFPTEDAITFDEIKKDMLTKIMKRDESPISGSGEHSTHQQHQQQVLINDIDKGWDVVVIDGTWSQARKIHAKYLQDYEGGCLYRVQLSDEAVKLLDDSIPGVENGDGSNTGIGGVVGKGHQLRRHPIKWREISTLEATRLLLNDMHTDGQFEEQSKAMVYYQQIGNEAARRQLGPPRV